MEQSAHAHAGASIAATTSAAAAALSSLIDEFIRQPCALLCVCCVCLAPADCASTANARNQLVFAHVEAKAAAAAATYNKNAARFLPSFCPFSSFFAACLELISYTHTHTQLDGQTINLPVA